MIAITPPSFMRRCSAAGGKERGKVEIWVRRRRHFVVQVVSF